jgi:hypothetical protein
LVALHNDYIEAFRQADPDAIIALYCENVQAAVRDYVDDTGTLVALDGREAHRDYYGMLFAKYQVVSVDLLHRVSADWYVFAELRITANAQSGPDAGKTVSFHTAEWLAPGHDGRFVARIGHGTDPA